MTAHSRPLIRGEKVCLRNFETSDAPLYAKWRSDAAPMASAGYGYRGPVSTTGSEQTIAQAHEVQGKPDWRFLLCLVEDDRPIGEVFLMHVDHENRSAEFGIMIGDPADWGKGYGTDALNAACDFGFGQLDLARIELRTRADNPGGRRSYEKAGFKLEGTLRSAVHNNGKRVDLLCMALLRDEWEQLPRKKSWDLDKR